MSDVVARWASRIILAAAPLAVALLMSTAACDERPAMHNGGGYEICALGPDGCICWVTEGPGDTSRPEY